VKNDKITKGLVVFSVIALFLGISIKIYDTSISLVKYKDKIEMKDQVDDAYDFKHGDGKKNKSKLISSGWFVFTIVSSFGWFIGNCRRIFLFKIASILNLSLIFLPFSV
jgi:hypothetical protein